MSVPTVSAIASISIPGPLEHELVDRLDGVVALLVQLVDLALRTGDGEVVVAARFVFLVPQSAVDARQLGDERAEARGTIVIVALAHRCSSAHKRRATRRVAGSSQRASPRARS